MAPTLFAGTRLRTSTFVYDDPEHPDRPTGLIHAPDWTVEDRLLLMGFEAYEQLLCPGCKVPKALAWHSEMSGGWFKATKIVCHSCSASRAEGDEVAYAITVDDRSEEQKARKPLPPFRIGETTTEPTPAPSPVRH